jgi:AcrR family transcriptional regulator
VINKLDTTASRGRGRPKGSNADTDILRGAARAFAKFGYHSCRIEDILEESKVSRTHFYRFFKSKEAVFSELVDREFSYVRKALKRLTNQFTDMDTPEERLVQVIEKNVELAMEGGPFIKILLQDLPQFEGYSNRMEDHDNQVICMVSKIIVSMGHPNPDDLFIKSIVYAVNKIMVGMVDSQESHRRKHAYFSQLILQLFAFYLQPQNSLIISTRDKN